MKTSIKFFSISNDRTVCRYDYIDADRNTAIALARTIGGVPLGLFSNAIVFDTVDRRDIEARIWSLRK